MAMTLPELLAHPDIGPLLLSAWDVPTLVRARALCRELRRRVDQHMLRRTAGPSSLAARCSCAPPSTAKHVHGQLQHLLHEVCRDDHGAPDIARARLLAP